MSFKSFLVDAREDAELLASGRLPKEISYVKKLPFPAKMIKALNAIQSKLAPSSIPDTKSEWINYGKSLLVGYTKFGLSQSGLALKNSIYGKHGKAVSNIKHIAALTSLGARIVEETNVEKLKRPQIEGPSINPAQAARAISETSARSIIDSMITNVALANGVSGTALQIFKTLASVKKSPRYFSGASGVQEFGNTAVQYVTSDASALPAQLGLLQDEIVYRLTLLAENVYAPIVDYASSQNYPPVVILEGFRAENTGKSQHERGEAMDITLGDGSLDHAENLFSLAKWCRDNVLYDVLVFCVSEAGGGQTWLHVSFTPETNRRRVYTKPFNDVHVEGLYLYNRYTDDAIQAQDKATAQQQEIDAQNFMTMMTQRDRMASPPVVSTGVGGEGYDGGECNWVPPPPGEGNGPYSWVLPPGVNLDRGYLDGVIRAYVKRVTGYDPDDPNFNWVDGKFDVSQWADYASKPDKFSDNTWRIGWNSYWESRIYNAWNYGDTATGSLAGADIQSGFGIIAGSENWPC